MSDILAPPPDTIVSPTAAVRGRRRRICFLLLFLLCLGGRSGGTAAPTPSDLAVLLATGFAAIGRPPAALAGGAPLAGVTAGRDFSVAALAAREGGGSPPLSLPAFFLFRLEETTSQSPVSPAAAPEGVATAGGGLATPGGGTAGNRRCPHRPGRGASGRSRRARRPRARPPRA